MGIVNGRPTVNVSTAARMCDVAKRTIYNWMESGRVEYVRTAGGRRRIFVDTLFRPDGPTTRVELLAP